MSTLLTERRPDAPAVAVSEWPASRPARTGSWAAALLSMGIVAGLMLVLFLRNHRYFFLDDRISGEIPKYLDIGRILQSGEFPWLSTNIVNGGGYAVEYGVAVFNPLNLALCVPLTHFHDIALGSFLYILVHAMLLTGSAAWLGRLLRLNTAWTVAFAVSVGFQPYTVVWDFAAWSQGLMSFAWLVLTVAACLAFHLQPRRRYGWLILLATFGTVTSGWPLAIPVLGLFVAALLVARLLARENRATTLWLGAWAAGGLLCSMIAVYPLLVSSQFASRDSSINNADAFNVAPLEGLLQFADPGYYGFFNNFGGYQLQHLPHFYVAWFLLPVLVFWRPGPLPRPFAVPARATVATLLVCAVATLGPERLLMFRYPTRFLQYAGFFLLLTAALLVAHGHFVFTRRRLYVLLALLGLLVVNALQNDPGGGLRVLPLGVFVTVLCGVMWMQGRAAGGGSQGVWFTPSAALANGVLVGGTAMVLLGLALANPMGRGNDWGFPHDLSTVKPLSGTDYTLYYGNYLPPAVNPQAFPDYHPTTMGLMVGDRQVNGYTSLGHRGFRKYFPIDDHGNFSLGGADTFSAVDPATGLQMIELFRVDQIISFLGPVKSSLAAAIGPRWRLDHETPYTAVFRHAPYPLPGLVSAVSPGLTASAVGGCPRTHSHECVGVANTRSAPGEVTFARLWFPGYRATLDGAPLQIEQHAGMLVSAVVPPGRAGTLVLSYVSPGFGPLAGISLVALLGLAFGSYRLPGTGPLRQRPAQPVARPVTKSRTEATT